MKEGNNIIKYDIMEYMKATSKHNLIKRFESIKIDSSWSFSDKTRKDTAYITHGYHRYPAKFIPLIVSRLIKKYTKEGDLVVDPFGGCGTTVVEAKVMGRLGVAVDINPEIIQNEFLKLDE